MTLCIASSNWLTADKFRQGLWEYCIEEDAVEPLPFNLKNGPGCYAGRDVGKSIKIKKKLEQISRIPWLVTMVNIK